MAVSKYDKNNLSQSDQDKISSVTDQAEKGQISWSDAHSQAEAIRNEAGYSGGRYGNEFIKDGSDETGGFGNMSVGGSGSGSSGGGSGRYQASDYTDYLKELYAQNLEAQLAGLKSSYDQNVKDLQAEADAIPQRYYEARNETAAQNNLQREYFNEMAAANGLNTGTTGQAALANSSTLQGNLSSISEKEKDALSANALEQNKLAIAYENAINQATASGNAALAQALYQEYVRQDNANLNAAQLAQEQANWQAQFDFSKQQYQDSLSQYQDSINAQNRDNAYNLAMTMLGAGVMPDSSTLTAAGISSADAMAIRMAALGGSSGTSSKASSGSTAGAKNSTSKGTSGGGYDNSGLTANQIQQLQAYIGVTPDGLWGSASSGAVNGATAQEAWRAYNATADVTDYASAVSALRTAGSNAIPMTQTEFIRHKNAGNNDYSKIRTYQDYLTAFVFSTLLP